jgi:3-deoxy-7-phosphoheptulonate synthase
MNRPIHKKIWNLNVLSMNDFQTPAQIRELFPVDEKEKHNIKNNRQTLFNILDRKDPRLFVVVGPCSVHDPEACIDYAHRLKSLADDVSDTFFIVMRTYFEKPRTVLGWKGFINDPNMDNSFCILEGMKRTRCFLNNVAKIGLPIATEMLGLYLPQYLGDLMSWVAIGARTSESQVHREMASALLTPVGFKNSTNGDISSAINSILFAANPQTFLGFNLDGKCGVIKTEGNKHCHIVLRGGGGQPNYDDKSIAMVEKMLREAKLNTNIVIDCSHDNSNKNHELQPHVLDSVVEQIYKGNSSIVGIMIESFIQSGKQSIEKDLKQLQYGCSVTDACIDWGTTETIIREAREKLKNKIRTR